jgi:Neuraminidase (sialidase)
VGGTDLHVVWKEDIGTNANIHFKNKAKEDANWSGAVDLTQTTAGKCLNPAIAVVDNGTNDHIHVVWEDYYEGNHRDILYRKSLDGGSTWENPLGSAPDFITEDAYHAYAPDIAITSTIPHVVWHGDPDGTASVYKETIYYSQDPDGDGLNWTDPYTVSTFSANENEFPAIAIDGSNRIHVTWYDFSAQVIQHRRSTDGGSTWSSVKDLTSGDNSTYPDIAAKGDDVYVVWNTDLGGNQYQVRCRRSTDGGSAWQTSRLIATVTTALISGYPTPRVSVDISDTVHVAWHALGTTDKQEIWHSQSTDNGANWSSPVNVSKNPDGHSQLASLGTDSEGDAHVAWQEQVSGQWDIFHSRTGVPGAGGGIYLPIIMKNY